MKMTKAVLATAMATFALALSACAPQSEPAPLAHPELARCIAVSLSVLEESDREAVQSIGAYCAGMHANPDRSPAGIAPGTPLKPLREATWQCRNEQEMSYLAAEEKDDASYPTYGGARIYARMACLSMISRNSGSSQ